MIAPVEEVDLKEVSKNIDNIKKEFSVIQEKAKSLGFVSSVPQNNTNIYTQQANVFSAISVSKDGVDSTSSPQVTTSTENIIYEVPKQEGFITKLTNFIKRVFSN